MVGHLQTSIWTLWWPDSQPVACFQHPACHPQSRDLERQGGGGVLKRRPDLKQLHLTSRKDTGHQGKRRKQSLHVHIWLTCMSWYMFSTVAAKVSMFK